MSTPLYTAEQVKTIMALVAKSAEEMNGVRTAFTRYIWDQAWINAADTLYTGKNRMEGFARLQSEWAMPAMTMSEAEAIIAFGSVGAQVDRHWPKATLTWFQRRGFSI